MDGAVQAEAPRGCAWRGSGKGWGPRAVGPGKRQQLGAERSPGKGSQRGLLARLPPGVLPPPPPPHEGRLTPARQTESGREAAHCKAVLSRRGVAGT